MSECFIAPQSSWRKKPEPNLDLVTSLAEAIISINAKISSLSGLPPIKSHHSDKQIILQIMSNLLPPLPCAQLQKDEISSVQNQSAAYNKTHTQTTQKYRSVSQLQ